MRLILVRHGESKHGVEHFIAGKAGCTGLTEHGAQQAGELARGLSKDAVRCDVLLSTSVKRAAETAALVGQQLRRDVTIDDDLCELLPGDADGLTWTAYRERYGEFNLQAQPDRPFAPNGESWNQFVGRVQSTVNRYAQTYKDENVIAVTHAGLIVVAFLLLFEVPFTRERSAARPRAEINPRYASITEWQVTDNRWELVRFNDTHHLTAGSTT